MIGNSRLFCYGIVQPAAAQSRSKKLLRTTEGGEASLAEARHHCFC